MNDYTKKKQGKNTPVAATISVRNYDLPIKTQNVLVIIMKYKELLSD